MPYCQAVSCLFLNRFSVLYLSKSINNVLCGFLADLKLVNLNSKLPPTANYSFRVDASGASSLVNHFFMSESLCDTHKFVDIIDSGNNLSDHCAVIMELLLPLEGCRPRNYDKLHV